MSNDPMTRVRGMLGFARRAGKLILGTELVCRSMSAGEKGKPSLVLYSEYASDATKKRIVTKGQYYRIPVMGLPLPLDEIGKMFGKESTPASLAVCDPGFAKEITDALNTQLGKEIPTDVGNR